jgi:hypothetical protein
MPPIDMTNLSYHVIEERKKRLEIVDNIGVGTPVATIEVFDQRDGRVYKTLTSTGVVVIRSKITNMVITLYLATIGQAFYIYRTSYGATARLPHNLYNTVMYNNAKYPRLAA